MSQPLLLVVTILSVLAALVLLGVVLVVLRREQVAAWIQGLFRRPQKPGTPPGPGHYYKPYWS